MLLLVSVPYEITLLSNATWFAQRELKVSVPYEITLLSNHCSLALLELYVSVPYEITLLSNATLVIGKKIQFQYLMKLHYSQTVVPWRCWCYTFQYLMKLHYSQTYLQHPIAV